MKILFLDDRDARVEAAERRFGPGGHELCVVRTAAEAIEFLEKETADLVMLDHDLDGDNLMAIDNPLSGAEVARWIRDNRPSIGQIVIHSTSHIGSPYMVNLLKDIYPITHEPMHIF